MPNFLNSLRHVKTANNKPADYESHLYLQYALSCQAFWNDYHKHYFVEFDLPGINFIIILHAAFTPADPKAQKDSQVKQLFALLGSASVKAARKHFVEFDLPGLLIPMKTSSKNFFFSRLELDLLSPSSQTIVRSQSYNTHNTVKL